MRVCGWQRRRLWADLSDGYTCVCAIETTFESIELLSLHQCRRTVPLPPPLRRAVAVDVGCSALLSSSAMCKKQLGILLCLSPFFPRLITKTRQLDPPPLKRHWKRRHYAGGDC